MEGTMTTTPRLTKSLTQVNTTDAAAQEECQIVSVNDGGYVVVWTDDSLTYNPDGSAIVGQRYDSLGNKVGGEVKISQFNSGHQSSPAITALPNGNVAIAFVDLVDLSDSDLFVRIFDPSLGLVRTDTIDTGANHTRRPSITAFADGSYVISYMVGTGGPSDIVARVVSPTGTVGAQFDIDNQTDNQERPEVATLSNGNFVVTYEDQVSGSGTNTDIMVAIVSAAGAVTVSGTIQAASGPGPERDPDVAALRNGGFVFVWTDPDTSVSDIRAAILSNAGSVVMDNILVNTTTTGQQQEASVVALADGGFLVTWNDDNADLVRAQRFDAAGNKIGTEFTVQTNGFDPQAAVLLDGRVAYAINDVSGDTGRDDIDLARTRRVARLRWRRQERRSLAPRQRAGLFLGDGWPGDQSRRRRRARSRAQRLAHPRHRRLQR
jgi:hypothetical protein